MKVYKANGKKKISIVTICLLLTVVMAIGGTLAYLFTNTAPVQNTFTPAKVGNYVIEDKFDGEVKTGVKVENSVKGNTTDVVDAYIRATYVVCWKDGNGNMLPAVNGDYTETLNLDKWVLHADGYYYYTDVVAPGGVTDVLITSIAPVSGKAPVGYTLSVEIISQSIQAEGTDASGKTPIEIAWKVKISGDTVVAVS